ncbi:MAG: restriction endonuclease subunit S [Faecousia sp.]
MVKPGYKQTEVGVIPEDWEDEKLGELAKVCMCKRIFADQTAETGEIPFFKIGTFGKEADAYISRSLYEDFKHRFSYPQKGDVLISAAGTLGRSVIFDGKDAYFQDSNIVWLDVDKEKLSNEYLYHYYKVIQWASSEGSTIARLYNGIICDTHIALPKVDEQEQIAGVLSEIDELIFTLEKQISKKKAIKQGAMQELLTGKRRLPGFSGDWQTISLKKALSVGHGMSQHDVECPTGRYPILATGGVIGRANRYLWNAPSVLIGRKGTISKPQYMDKPFWSIDTLFYTKINEGYCPKFLYYVFCRIDWLSYNEASGVPSLSAKTIESIEVQAPDYREQCAIAGILTDIDTEIEALERKLGKYRQVKRGMMQQLLTGKIRLA